MTLEEVALVATVLGLAFWRNHWFLNIMAGMVAISFGIRWGETYLVEGIAIAAIGTYFLVNTARDLLRR